MIFTAMYLTKEQREALKKRALEQKMSMAEVIRRILDKDLNENG